MKKSVLSALAVGLLSTSAMAADISAPSHEWGGFYAGVLAGYSWNNVEISDVTFQDDGEPPVPGSLVGIDTYTIDSTGGELGGTLGFNHQTGNLVLGVEADLSYSWATGENDKYEEFPGFTSEADLDWFGTARLRAGYAFDRALVYATGGLAFGGVEGTINDNYEGTIVTTSDSFNMMGWTIGGGLEYAVTDKISVKGEYLYYDLGEADLSVNETDKFPDGWDEISSDVHLTGSVVRAGLNYRF